MEATEQMAGLQQGFKLTERGRLVFGRRTRAGTGLSSRNEDTTRVAKDGIAKRGVTTDRNCHGTTSLEAYFFKAEEVLEIMDRVESLITGKKGCLESTMRKTVERSEKAWNESVKLRENKETYLTEARQTAVA